MAPIVRVPPDLSPPVPTTASGLLATDRALRDFDRAIGLKPDDGLAYRGRGVAHHDTGEFERAVADLARAAELRPADPYPVIRLLLAESRIGVEAAPRLRERASGLDLARWPGHVIPMLLGEASGDQVIEAAKRTDPKVRREALCEAYYYLGHDLAIRGRPDRAAGMFQAAVAAGPSSSVEYSGARAELTHRGR